MNINIGFSPCPNDTYMLAALIHGWIDTQGLTFTPYIEDVETLNGWAASGKLDVTKLSFHRALSLENKYQLLSAGAALGFGCGPLLIAKSSLTTQQILQEPIALPGQWTTAHLLFNMFFPGAIKKTFHLFSDIEDLVLRDEVIAGVIIHENRFTYASKGLVKILDLGEAWEQETSLPIPLGALFASTSLPKEVVHAVEQGIRKSILFARDHPDEVMPYVRSLAVEMDEEVIREHIRLYVNDFSLDLGQEGHKAVEALRKRLPAG